MHVQERVNCPGTAELEAELLAVGTWAVLEVQQETVSDMGPSSEQVQVQDRHHSDKTVVPGPERHMRLAADLAGRLLVA